MRYLALLAVLAGCDSSDRSGDNDGSVVLLGQPCSVDDVTGTLPGVSVSISSSSCLYRVGEPAQFTYRVTTTAAVPAIDIPDSSSCACDHRTAEISSWLAWSIGGTSASGNSQQYCLCDTGCCAPQASTTITPVVGTFANTLEWSGRVWGGPSDTGNPEGAFFQVGTYGVTVRFSGYAMGFVEATLPIEILGFPR